MQVHFQYGKRDALTGATACFNHKKYITYIGDTSPDGASLNERPDNTGTTQP